MGQREVLFCFGMGSKGCGFVHCAGWNMTGRTWRAQEGSGGAGGMSLSSEEGRDPHGRHKHRRPGGLWQGHFGLHRNRRQS